MSDFSCSFKPWENNFTEGLYLAGVEAADEAEAPEGWVKWTIPGYEYLYVKCTDEDIFRKVLAYMEGQGMKLAGAVQFFLERIFEHYPKVHVDASFPAEGMYLKRGYEIASYEKNETGNGEFL